MMDKGAIKNFLLNLFCVFIFLFGSFFLAPVVFAKDSLSSSQKVNLYFFWGKGCPHCEKEKVFLEKLAQKYPALKVNELEVWYNKENQDLLTNVAKKLNANVSGVPFTVIGEEYFVGWYNEEVTGSAIENAVKCAIEKGCRDVVLEIQHQKETCKTPGECATEEERNNLVPQKVKLPFLGEIETKNISLPILSVVLGLLDGFNPCAMWALIFLISLLLGMKDRKRMWILGSAFILASAAVYFLFITAWLNFILFVGIVFWVRILVGLIAFSAGGYNLREFFANKADSCKITGEERRQRIFEKLKLLTKNQKFWLALGGIIILAFLVNFVELVCSAGLPVVFTQILALNNLLRWQYYFYIFIYLFFFMLDDLLVFFGAMITLHLTGVSTKYSHWARLAGGIIMLIIGVLLIFKPEWLMFG